MVQSATDPVTLAGEPLYHRGIELYGAGRFFECHEVLEELWTPMRGPHRLYLQALIHFAVAFYHLQRRNPLGAERQLRKALRKIEHYLPAYEGLDTATLHREGQQCLSRILRNESPDPPRMTTSKPSQ
jgi:predicted metal-dependent hydrolase